MTMLSLPPESLPPCISGNVGLILSRLVPLLEATAEWQVRHMFLFMFLCVIRVVHVLTSRPWIGV